MQKKNQGEEDTSLEMHTPLLPSIHIHVGNTIIDSPYEEGGINHGDGWEQVSQYHGTGIKRE